MKQIVTLSAMLLLITVILSWRKPTGGPPPATSTTALLSKPTTPALPGGPGTPVTRAQYQPCLDSFVAVMGRYGIIPGSPMKNPSCPALTYPITTFESFQASGLLSWMQGEVAKWDPSGGGANLDFQMKFGILTRTFVATFNQPDSLVGRIAVFVVPAFRTDGAVSAAKSKAKTNAAPPDDPGDDGYELGGLHP